MHACFLSIWARAQLHWRMKLWTNLHSIWNTMAGVDFNLKTLHIQEKQLSQFPMFKNLYHSSVFQKWESTEKSLLPATTFIPLYKKLLPLNLVPECSKYSSRLHLPWEQRTDNPFIILLKFNIMLGNLEMSGVTLPLDWFFFFFGKWLIFAKNLSVDCLLFTSLHFSQRIV